MRILHLLAFQAALFPAFSTEASASKGQYEVAALCASIIEFFNSSTVLARDSRLSQFERGEKSVQLWSQNKEDLALAKIVFGPASYDVLWGKKFRYDIFRDYFFSCATDGGCEDGEFVGLATTVSNQLASACRSDFQG